MHLEGNWLQTIPGKSLYRDQKEMYPITDESPFDYWARWPATKILGEHMKSLQEEPPIKPGTPDPYVPAKKSPRRICFLPRAHWCI